MLFVAEIIHDYSYYESDSQDFKNHPFDRKRKSYPCVFHKRERQKISDEMNFLCSEKMLEKVFRGLVEEDEESENEGEHIFCFLIKLLL
jgi:hypothetical protein